MSDKSKNVGEKENFSRAKVKMLKVFISDNAGDLTLLCTRIAAVLFILSYLAPVPGWNGVHMYYNALVAHLATSLVRLYQKCPLVEMNVDILMKLLGEDSAHYFLYSCIFLLAPPVHWAWLPIFLSSLLHSANYSIELLDKMSHTDFTSVLKVFFIVIVEGFSVHLLMVAAVTEILLFPLVTLQSLSYLPATLALPFAYSHFLTLRYSSRANPFSKIVFGKFHCWIASYLENPLCPTSIREVMSIVISFICRLVPEEKPMETPVLEKHLLGKEGLISSLA